MKRFYLLLFIGLFCSGASAQLFAAPEAAESREEAQAIIDQTCKSYDSFSSIQIDFVMTVRSMGIESVETIKGMAQGNKYRLEGKDQNIICDGKTVWFHLKAENKILQSSPNDNEVNIIFPAKMLRIYEKNYDFKYSGEFKLGENVLQKLEFFPKSDLEKFSKINVYIDKKTSQIVRVSRFGKDGTLYLLDLKNVIQNKKLDPAIFKLEMS